MKGAVKNRFNFSRKTDPNLSYDHDQFGENKSEPSRGIAALEFQGRSQVEAGHEDGVRGRAANLRPQRDLLANVALQRMEVDGQQRYDEVYLQFEVEI